MALALVDGQDDELADAQSLVVPLGVSEPDAQELGEGEPEGEGEALPLSLWDVLPVAQTELVEDGEVLGEPLGDSVAVTDIEADCDADEHDENDGDDEGHGLGDCDEEVDRVED